MATPVQYPKYIPYIPIWDLSLYCIWNRPWNYWKQFPIEISRGGWTVNYVWWRAITKYTICEYLKGDSFCHDAPFMLKVILPLHREGVYFWKGVHLKFHKIHGVCKKIIFVENLVEIPLNFYHFNIFNHFENVKLFPMQCVTGEIVMIVTNIVTIIFAIFR